MKKIITCILVCSSLSLGLIDGNCSSKQSHRIFFNFFLLATGTYFDRKTDEAGLQPFYMIGIGPNGTIYKSTGVDTINFQPKTSGTTQNLNDVAIRSSGEELLAVGNNGTIVRSLSYGNTWSVVTAVTSADLNAVRWGYDGRQFAAGDNGTILRGTNFGLNWSVIPSGTTRKLFAISSHAAEIQFVVAAGEKGTILRSTNFGLNWTNISLADTSINLHSINPAAAGFTEITPFYICGSQGRIYKSTDYGATWVLKNSGTTNTLRSIFFTTDDSGAVTGDNGTVRMTTNGGDSWFTDTYFSNVTGSVKSCTPFSLSPQRFIALSDSNSLYIASEDTVVVIIGINNISSEIPKEFSLSQNYPNPFNPSSKFNVQISKLSDVKIVVFDVSGKELEILVNEQLKPGTYEVDFNGSKYSSGIYFYRMTARRVESSQADFSETKKMVLVK